MVYIAMRRAAEFYSGIGGWAAALRKLGAEYEVVAAFDINLAANAVYEHNHRTPKPSPKSLEKVLAKELDSVNAELWMMSPPCQPHTRNNVTDKRDENDPRSNSFLHLIMQLQSMKQPPKAIILENVVGFETSSCCRRFLEVLSELSYDFEQYLLSPIQFGIPNARPRYYCIAWKRCEGDTATLSAAVAAISDAPSLITSIAADEPTVRPLSDFLQPEDADMSEHVIPVSFIEQHMRACWCWDIAHRDSQLTACYTKAYSRYHKGAGSVLLDKLPSSVPADSWRDAGRKRKFAESGDTAEEIVGSELVKVAGERARETMEERGNELERAVDGRAGLHEYDPDWLNKLFEGKEGMCIRYLSPQELLRLFGFPAEFSFPAEFTASAVGSNKRKPVKVEALTTRKSYELIGNSINITVASALLAKLISKL